MPYKDPEKQREYQRLYVKRVRRAFFKAKICERCGAVKNLQIHHRDPAKKISHHIWSWSEKRRNAELQKCVVWCKPCHVEHHAELERKHGRARFRAGCHCPVCVAAELKYQSNRPPRKR